MGFPHKNKLNLELPYKWVDAAKPQGPCQGRTLRHGLGPALSADLCLQPAKAPSALGTPEAVDGPSHRAHFDIHCMTITLGAVISSSF